MEELFEITKAALTAGEEKMSSLFGEALGTYKLYSTEASCTGEYYELEFRLCYASEEFKTLCDVVWNIKKSRLRLVFFDDNDDMTNEMTIYPDGFEDAKNLIIRHNKGWGSC